MKIKRLLILLIPLFLIIILIFQFIPKNKEKRMLVISDYLWYNYNFIEKDINSSYTYPSLTSKELLRYIEDDTLKIGDDTKSLRKEIKNANSILISIGMEDFISDIIVSKREKRLTYDKTILSLRADIFINQYQHIIEEILLLNKDIKLLSTSLYYPYPYINDEELKTFFFNINKDLKEINKNGVYLDISQFSQEKYLDSISEYKLNTIALNQIYSQITNLNSLHH